MNCHCPETLQRESFAIACKRFSGTHSFDSIAEKIQVVHDKIGLDYKKITRTITDNASNFAKAFCEFGFKEQNENDDQESSEDEVNFESINSMVTTRSLEKMMKSFLFCPRKKDVSLIHSV